MTTEYSKIKLASKISDPCNTSDTAYKSSQVMTHDVDNNGAKSKVRRKIVRDGGVVTITCLESGRSREVPWSSVVEAVPVPVAVQGQAKKS